MNEKRRVPSMSDRHTGFGAGDTRPVEQLLQWFVDEYNKGPGYAKVVLHPEGTLTERPSAQYPQGRKVDLSGLIGMGRGASLHCSPIGCVETAADDGST
jgi:hypothetical protein